MLSRQFGIGGEVNLVRDRHAPLGKVALLAVTGRLTPTRPGRGPKRLQRVLAAAERPLGADASLGDCGVWK